MLIMHVLQHFLQIYFTYFIYGYRPNKYVSKTHMRQMRGGELKLCNTPPSSSLRGRQLLSCLALRPQIGPNALPLTNQNPTTKAKGYILLKKGKRKSKKHYPSYIKE